MLKKIFSTLCLAVMILFVTNAQAHAEGEGGDASISVILDTPEGTFAEPDVVYTAVQETLDKIFNHSSLNVKSVSECDAYVQMYREENDRSYAYEDNYAYAAGRDIMFKKADIQKMCNHFGDEYCVYMRVTTTNPRSTGGVFTSGRKVNVVLDFRIWSRAKDDFVYMARKTTTGSSDTVNITVFGSGSGSTQHAVDKGLKKALAEVEKDKNKILASIEG